MNKIYEYNVKMCQSAQGLQNFASFIANRFCGNWQVTTTYQDVHDVFEFKRNAVKRDIESYSGFSEYQKFFYCQQSDRQIWSQEIFISLLFGKTNLLR